VHCNELLIKYTKNNGATENARLENGAQSKCRGGKCETGKWSTKMLLRSSTLSEKSNPLDTVFFPDTVYKRYANNEPNSNHTSLVG